MGTIKRAHPRDFGIPEEHWQAAADYAGMVIFQGDGASLSLRAATREAAVRAQNERYQRQGYDEAAVERLARFLAEEAHAGACTAVPADRWRGHVGDARDMLRAAMGLDKAGTTEAAPVRTLATPGACNVEDRR